MMAIAAGIVELLEDYKDPDDLDEFSVITLQVTLDSSVSGADSDEVHVRQKAFRRRGRSKNLILSLKFINCEYH